MKKQLEKKFEHIVRMIERIEQYNNYLNDNRYYEGHGCYNKQLSFDVKMHNAYFPTDVVEDYLTSQNITGDRREQILEEFDDKRLDGIYYHYIEDQQNGFRNDVTEWDEHPLHKWIDIKDVGFYGRGGGHLCLGRMESFELEIGDTEVGDYPVWNWSNNSGMYWSFNKPIEELINAFKEHFNVSSQKEVYKQLVEDSRRGDLKSYYDTAVENQAKLEKLEKQITEFKKNAKKYLLEFLYSEIENFIAEEYGIEMAIEQAEAGDYSKLDTIKDITDAYLITNRNAKVPLKEVRSVLKAILTGYDVVGRTIGHFTINSVDKRKHDTYVKVGCHLFSLSQTESKLAI